MALSSYTAQQAGIMRTSLVIATVQTVLSAEYSDVQLSQATTQAIYRWTGTQWEQIQASVWNGTEWVLV